MKTKPTTIVLTGFSLIIFLVAISLFVSLHQINTSNDELRNNIDTKSEHATRANALQNISNQRSVLMLKILQSTDPFERDDYIQEFYQHGESFIQIREKFYNSNPDSYEEELLNKHRSFISQVVKAQHHVIDLKTQGKYMQAHHIFMDEALPKQQINLKYLNQLSSYQSKQISLITSKLTLQQDKTFRFILMTGLSVIIFCFLIAWFIYQRLTRNVTELQSTKDDLSVSLIEQKNLLYALNKHAIVSITDTTGHITFANEKFCEVSQYSKAELIGKRHNIINSGFHKKSVFRDMWATIVSGSTWQGEIKNRKKDGSYYWVESSIIPFLDKNKLPYQYIAIRTDVTHIKNIEEDLQKSLEQLATEAEKAQQSNTLKDAIISTMTHELRTPLNSILGFTQLLQFDVEGFSEIQIDNINNIELAGNELLNKIEVIMLYSKLKSKTLKLQYSESELSLIFASIISKFESDNKTYSVYPKIISTKDIDVTADIPLLQKALSYIINNAMKFTKQGHIHINFEEISINSELPKHTAPATSDLILITIEDTGIGISANNMKMIFDDFRQAEENDNRRFEGIGIGLSLTKSIIEQHNGEVWLDSDLNKGTTVYITIPIVHDSALQTNNN